jgi:ribosomal protein S1
MYQQSSSIRRRPYNLEAKMRMKQYRREAMQRQRAQEIEDEERNFQLDTSKLYKKGDPGTVQGVVKDIITVGYFMKLPNGREGFLPCSQFGCSGGIPLLTRIFKVGDEITVRAEIVGDGGKDRLYCRDTDKWA